MLIVSVSRHTIENNLTQHRNDPPFEIRRSKDDPTPKRVHSQEFHGTIRLMYDPNAPLVSSAYCWIEIDEIEAEQVMTMLNGAAHAEQPKPGQVINVGVVEAAIISDGA